MQGLKESGRWGVIIGGVLLASATGCLPDSILLKPVNYTRDLNERVLDREGLFAADKIAVIDVEGVILNSNQPSLLNPGENPVVALLEQLDEAREDPRVKAVVLRINSPGGSVTASELMHAELLRFRETGKPVIAMLLDVAASGGYYIACAADEIVAARSTVTGSIGVIMQTFDATGPMQRIGLRADAIKRGDQKGAGSPFESMTPEQRAVFQQIILELYDQFVEVVAVGRELEEASVRALADGRVYTAGQALECGLIDHIGTMPQAIALAKERAGVERATLITYARQFGHAPNYYARQPVRPVAAQVNLLNVDLGPGRGPGRPPFMYIWDRY